MSYSHLSIIERGQLETLHRLGWSCRRIGRELGRHPSTIAREPSRGRKPGEAYDRLYGPADASGAENAERACRKVYGLSGRRD